MIEKSTVACKLFVNPAWSLSIKYFELLGNITVLIAVIAVTGILTILSAKS